MSVVFIIILLHLYVAVMEPFHDKVCVYLLSYTLISGSILSVSHTYTWIKDVCFLSLTLVIIRKFFLKRLFELGDVTQLSVHFFQSHFHMLLKLSLINFTFILPRTCKCKEYAYINKHSSE